jgi:outer membrane immunogenic protein
MVFGYEILWHTRNAHWQSARPHIADIASGPPGGILSEDVRGIVGFPVSTTSFLVLTNSGGHSMKKFIVGCAMLVGLGSAALAADMPLKAPVPVAPVFDWGGLYAGGSVSWFHSRTNWQLTNPSPATLLPFSDTESQAAWGVHGGAQWQFSQIVLGIEADYTSPQSSFKGATSNGTATSVCTTLLGEVCQTRVSNISTVGARAGWVFGDWLIFGQGGWAAGTVESQFFLSPTVVDTARNSDYRNGWYAGGGVNYALYKTALMDVIIGADYRHIDLRSRFQTSSLDAFGPAPPGVNGRNISGTADQVRFTVSLKTNGWGFAGPIVAKY